MACSDTRQRPVRGRRSQVCDCCSHEPCDEDPVCAGAPRWARPYCKAGDNPPDGECSTPNMMHVQFNHHINSPVLSEPTYTRIYTDLSPLCNLEGPHCLQRLTAENQPKLLALIRKTGGAGTKLNLAKTLTLSDGPSYFFVSPDKRLRVRTFYSVRREDEEDKLLTETEHRLVVALKIGYGNVVRADGVSPPSSPGTPHGVLTRFFSLVAFPLGRPPVYRNIQCYHVGRSVWQGCCTTYTDIHKIEVPALFIGNCRPGLNVSIWPGTKHFACEHCEPRPAVDRLNGMWCLRSATIHNASWLERGSIIPAPRGQPVTGEIGMFEQRECPVNPDAVAYVAGEGKVLYRYPRTDSHTTAVVSACPSRQYPANGDSTSRCSETPWTIRALVSGVTSPGILPDGPPNKPGNWNPGLHTGGKCAPDILSAKVWSLTSSRQYQEGPADDQPYDWIPPQSPNRLIDLIQSEDDPNLWEAPVPAYMFLRRYDGALCLNELEEEPEEPTDPGPPFEINIIWYRLKKISDTQFEWSVIGYQDDTPRISFVGADPGALAVNLNPLVITVLEGLCMGEFDVEHPERVIKGSESAGNIAVWGSGGATSFEGLSA